MATPEERGYQKACWAASAANYTAHDAFVGPSSANLTKVPIYRGYKPLSAAAYDTTRLYLALDNGHWRVGKVWFYEPQSRFLFDSYWAHNSTQVEHLQQLYLFDIEAIPAQLVPYPAKPDSEEDDDD